MSPESNQNEPEKLERNTPTVVFDYKNFFSQLRKFAADQYNQMNQIKMPDVSHVIFNFLDDPTINHML